MHSRKKRPIRLLVVTDMVDDDGLIAEILSGAWRNAIGVRRGDGCNVEVASLLSSDDELALFGRLLKQDGDAARLRAPRKPELQVPVVFLEEPDTSLARKTANANGSRIAKGRASLRTLPDVARVSARSQDEFRAAAREPIRAPEAALLDSVLMNLPIVAGRIDDRGCIAAAHGNGLDHADLGPGRLAGMRFAALHAEAGEAFRLALQGGRGVFRLSGEKDGREWCAEFVVTRDQERDGCATFAGRDVTEEFLLARQLLAATDAEKERIGADLHDGLGQQFTGISCLAAALCERLKRRGIKEATMAGEVSRLLNDAISLSRALARGLCPEKLKSAGLLTALGQLASQSETLHGIECRFVRKGGDRPLECDCPTALHLYRITQEAINNAVRHGGARRICVSLVSHGSTHELVVADDGCGFEASKDGAKPGACLRTMSYRAAMIGGELSAGPRAGGGARVTCRFVTPEQSDEEAIHGWHDTEEDCEVAS